MTGRAHVLATVEHVEIGKLDRIDVGLGLVELRLGIRELTQGSCTFALVFGPAALVLGETAFVGSPSARKLYFSAFDAGGTFLDLLPSLIELRATSRKLGGSDVELRLGFVERILLFGELRLCLGALLVKRSLGVGTLHGVGYEIDLRLSRGKARFGFARAASS